MFVKHNIIEFKCHSLSKFSFFGILVETTCTCTIVESSGNKKYYVITKFMPHFVSKYIVVLPLGSCIATS